MRRSLRHIIHFILGASLCGTLMFLMQWDALNEWSHLKLSIYSVIITGLFFSCAMHEHKTK